MADDVCGKHSTFETIAGQELDRAEPVIFVLPVRFDVVLSVHTFRSLVESRFSRIRGRNSRNERLSHTAWIRRSSRLRRTTGYATVLLPLPGISFTAVTLGHIPSGTPNLIIALHLTPPFF